MNKLTSLTFQGVKYKVKFKETHESEDGHCDKVNKIITVDPNGDIFDTLVHEATHAMCKESFITGVLSEDMEEMICLMNEKLFRILVDGGIK